MYRFCYKEVCDKLFYQVPIYLSTYLSVVNRYQIDHFIRQLDSVFIYHNNMQNLEGKMSCHKKVYMNFFLNLLKL